MGCRSPREGAEFWGLSGLLLNIVSHCCGVRSKKINNGICTTDAADCIALDWPVSHEREKSAPLMRPLVKLLWPFIIFLAICSFYFCRMSDLLHFQGTEWPMNKDLMCRSGNTEYPLTSATIRFKRSKTFFLNWRYVNKYKISSNKERLLSHLWQRRLTRSRQNPSVTVQSCVFSVPVVWLRGRGDRPRRRLSVAWQ